MAITGLAKGPTDFPSTIPEMYIRLKSSDLPLNLAVSAWKDEVSNIYWTNANAGTQFTNSALGVFLDTGQFLESSTNFVALGVNDEFLFIFNYVNTSAYETIFGDPNGESLIGLFVGAAGFGSVVTGNAVAYWSKPALGDGVFHDCLTIGGNGISSTGYTNGVASLSYTPSGGFPRINRIGNNQAGHADQYKGYIAEIIVWTNHTGAFSSTTISNLHYYATNTYNFSP